MLPCDYALEVSLHSGAFPFLGAHAFDSLLNKRLDAELDSPPPPSRPAPNAGRFIYPRRPLRGFIRAVPSRRILGIPLSTLPRCSGEPARSDTRPVSLIDDLARARNRKPNFSEWLIARTPSEREAFETAAADLLVSDESLAVIVRKHGGATTRDTIKVWRSRHVAD